MHTFLKTEKRIENKYITNSIDISKFLLNIYRFGFVRVYRPRFVSSLYYDDINFTSAGENLAGITPRTKYRLRWYNETYNKKKFNFQFEKKIKEGLYGYKKIFKLNRDFSGENLKIENLNKNLLDKEKNLPTFLEPKVICSYHRDYYEN